jgi:hypothetical protein
VKAMTSHSEYISKTEAAEIAGVHRRTIYYWLKTGRLKTDASGHIARAAFECANAQHVLVSRLRATLDQIPAHAVAPILIEVLGPDYIRSLAAITAPNKGTNK